MTGKKQNFLVLAANILIFFFVIVFQVSGAVDISIKTATPLVILPLITAYAVFGSLPACAVAGIIAGACLDGVANGAYCFNTITLFLISVAVCLAANNLFNKNIQSAVALSLITSAVYFLLLWQFFYAWGVPVKDSLGFLLSYAMPSTLYTALFIFPFYFIFKFFEKHK